MRDARLPYDAQQIDVDSVEADPLRQCALWLEEALTHPELIEPHAMTLASVDPCGIPSARIVLLRDYDERGFVFFTNYHSRKGYELDATGVAALLFYWDRLERELRIEGQVERLYAGESDEYFARRPREHQLSAWASPQSQPIANRQQLEQAMELAEAQFVDSPVPRPAHWGGYRVRPERFEFWQGRANRLHDRIRYDRVDVEWVRSRLAP